MKTALDQPPRKLTAAEERDARVQAQLQSYVDADPWEYAVSSPGTTLSFYQFQTERDMREFVATNKALRWEMSRTVRDASGNKKRTILV